MALSIKTATGYESIPNAVFAISVPTSATISSIFPNSVFVGVETDVTVTFSKNVATITSHTIAGGGSITAKTFIPGTTTAVWSVIATSGTTGIGATLLDVLDTVSAAATKPITGVTVSYPAHPIDTAWNLTPDVSTVTVDASNNLLNMKNLITGLDAITSPGVLSYDANTSTNAKSMVWDPTTGTLIKSVNAQSFYIAPGLTSSDWSLVMCYYYTGKQNFVQLFTTSDLAPGNRRDSNYFTKIGANTYDFNSTTICTGADPSLNAWHVSVITHAIATRTFTVYLDGVLMGSNASPMPNNSAGKYPGDVAYMNFYQNGNQISFCHLGTTMLVKRQITPAEVTAVTSSCLAHWQPKIVDPIFGLTKWRYDPSINFSPTGMTSLGGGIALSVSNNPVLVQTVFGSLPGVRIRSNTHNLALNDPTLGTISLSTCFAVMDLTLTQDNNGTGDKLIFGGVPGGRNYLFLNPANKLTTWFNTPGGSVTATLPIPTRKAVFCARWNGAQYTAFHNGAVFIDENAGATPAGNLGANLGIGSYTEDTNPVWSADAYVGEIIIYNTPLSDAKVLEISNSLRAKWSLPNPATIRSIQPAAFVQGVATNASLTFNKVVAACDLLSITGGGSVAFKSLTGTTAEVTVTASSTSTAVSASLRDAAGLTVPASVAITNLLPLAFDMLAEVSAPALARTQFNLDTTYTVLLKFKNQALNIDYSQVALTCDNASIGPITAVDLGTGYRITLRPTTRGTLQQLKIVNAKDVHGNVYPPLVSPALTFCTVFVPTAGLVSWYDMSDISTVSKIGLYISSVVDKYGGYDLLDSNPESTYETGLAGSKYYYSNRNMDGNSNFLKCSDPRLYTNCTYFASIRLSPPPFCDNIMGFTYGIGHGRLMTAGGGIHGITGFALDDPKKTAVHVLDTTSWYIISLEVTNGGLNIRTKVWNHPSDKSYHLGTGTAAYPIRSFSFGKSVDIGEVFLYDGIVSDADSLSVANNLKVKWDPLAFDMISDFNSPLISKTDFNVNTLYTLYVKFKRENLSSDYSNVSIECLGAIFGPITSMDSSQYYKFTMTPTVIGTGKQLTIRNAKDANNVEYTSIYSLANLSFNSYILKLDASLVSFDVSNHVTNWNVAGSTMVTGLYSSIAYMTYQPNSLNGLGTVKLNNTMATSCNRINIPVTQLSGNFDIFMVVKLNAKININNGLMLDIWPGNRNIGVYNNDGKMKLLISSAILSTPFDVMPLIGSWFIVRSSLRADSSSSISFVVNGVVSSFPAIAPFTSGGVPTELNIGSYPANGHGLDYDLAEFRAYDGIMSASGISTITSELRTKWGV